MSENEIDWEQELTALNAMRDWYLNAYNSGIRSIDNGEPVELDFETFLRSHTMISMLLSGTFTVELDEAQQKLAELYQKQLEEEKQNASS